MDTTSHVFMGLGLTVIGSHIGSSLDIETTIYAVGAVSILSNVVPDFDTVIKLKSNSSYINNHRGPSHSLISLVLLSTLIGLLGTLFFTGPFIFYFILSFIGIFMHLTADLSNSYGVKLLWPFSQKWIALGITYTFDSIFLLSHVLLIFLFFFNHINLFLSFIILYSVLLIYLVFQFILNRIIRMFLKRKYGNFKRCLVQSRTIPFRWKYVYETQNHRFFIGRVNLKGIYQLRYEKRHNLSEEVETVLRNNAAIKSFLEFTPIYNYKIHKDENTNIKTVTFYDLRYLYLRKKRQYYGFNAICELNENNEIISSYVGFQVKENSFLKRLDSGKA